MDNYQNYRNLGEYDGDKVSEEEEEEEMKKFYITFGFIHKDSKGQSLRNCYTIIEAENEAKAREIMFSSPLGNQWAFCYKTAQDAGIIKYGLNLVPFSQL